MYTLRKLQKMKPAQRLRKAVVLLKRFESALKKGESPDTRLLEDFFHFLRNESTLDSGINGSIDQILDEKFSDIRTANTLRYLIIDNLGESRADWDFDEVISSDKNIRCIYPVSLYLDGIRSPFNCGSMIRTAEAMGFTSVYHSPDMSVMDHERTLRTSMGSLERINHHSQALEDLPGPLVALELGGSHLYDFSFPLSGTIAVGSEELGVSDAVLEKASREGGIVSIPLFGAKASLNVGTAFSIIAYEWIKQINLSFQG